MKKLLLICLLAIIAFASEAQMHGRIYVGPSYRYGYRRPPMRARFRQQPVQRRERQTAFQPSVNISFGYGFPNLDKNNFVDFVNLYKGNVTNQSGPFTGAIDYQFSRYMSIGVLGTYGKVSQPYYTNNTSSAIPDLTGKYENWSLMLNLVNYFPTRTKAVSPYLRTAIGINNWKQDYTDASGFKTEGIDEPDMLAYQASLGARFNLSPRAGIYVEAGYGKYIVNGGLALKF